MTADSYSARLGLIKQATGNNNNNWGDIFNSSFTDLIDRALWGIDAHAVTGGTLDLSTGTLPPAGPSPVAGSVQNFTGTLTSDQTVIFPSLAGRWTMFNNTTGNFSLLLKTSGMATPIQIPQGKFVDVISDGTTMYRKDRHEVGRPVYHAAVTLPAGVLQMSGQSLLRASYPDLFAVISTTYGAVDGTHFTLPNLSDTGRFIRAAGGGGPALGQTQSNQNAAHTHTITGAPGVGTLATDSQGAHSHTASVSDPTHAHSGVVTSSNNYNSPGGATIVVQSLVGGISSAASTGISVSIVSAGAHVHNVTGAPSVGSLGTASSGGTEARPESIGFMACINY
jgi:microcystin-dependent protein